MTTFITRYETTGPGVRLAVKDLIDMEGEPTTAGCRAVADRAVPADRDAACLTGAREAGARIVGRTNLHELALGVTGVNQWYGTPVNPLDPTRVPGGSSSGSAVAVATGEADVAYGSDTGGSIRIPAACCGTTGLKTTWGRIPLDGVWPLAPSFDTVGPMARTVAGLVTGMQLLEPGFSVGDRSGADLVVGRLAIDADPAITAALDEALGSVGWDCRELEVPGWDDATMQAGLLLVVEAWHADGALVAQDPAGISDAVRERLELGGSFDENTVARAWSVQRAWKDTLARVFTEVDLLITPTLSIFPPHLDDGDDLLVSRCTLPVNLAGVPALSLPVPTGGPLPASAQLIGPAFSEERLLAAAAVLEAAVAG
ncbi:MAG TPA: amidase [Acidimicrobiales bacterium]|jgi:amidase|nr:amidase [Acidimicrobiales bacterium]